MNKIPPDPEQPPQQWQMLASPGHTLLAQVDSYSAKVKSAFIALCIGVAMGYLVLLGTPALASAASGFGGAIGWVVLQGEKLMAPAAPQEDRAPRLTTFGAAATPANVYSLVTDASQVTSTEQLGENMRGLLAAFRSGQKIEACVPGKKVTEPWAAQGDLGVRCKYSADGRRLWVWMAVNNAGRFNWYVGLVRQFGSDTKDAVVLNLREPGLLAIPGIESIEARHIPRTLAIDFPELKVDNKGAK